MPIIDDPRIYDAFSDLAAGVDGHIYPLNLPANRVANAVNCSFRGGIVGTRPGIRAVPLSFEDAETQARFERFPIQGGEYYYHKSHDGRLVCMVGGRLFSIAIDGEVEDITLTDDASSGSIPQMWFCQAENYMVIQDGALRPIILDGTTARRATATEVPPGTMMAYGQSRIVVASKTMDSFKFGDIHGGATTVLSFTETEYLNEAPSFSLPHAFGKITFFAFLSQADTAAGVGALIVGGASGLLAINTTVPRTDWLNTDISRAIVLDVGGVGQSATAHVNGDLFFRSKQGGIRSIRMARSDEAGWGRTPVSREVENWLSFDSTGWLKYCGMKEFDNRLFCTTIPKIQDSFVNHLGMVILNFDLLGGIGGKQPPAWEGIWTGITPTVLVSGQFDDEQRMLALCHDEDGINRLYEITKGAFVDLDDTRIQSSIETRVMDFGSRFNSKELLTADLWVTDVRGETEFVIKWRREDSGVWTEWHRFTLCAASGSCASADCLNGTAVAGAPTAKSRIKLPRPPAVCATDGSLIEYAFGYAFQFRIEWEGFAKISRFRAHALREAEDGHGACETSEACTELTECGEDDLAYNLALDVLGVADALITEESDTAPFTFDLRQWRNTKVRGRVWVIEGVNDEGASIVYLRGSIDGYRMIGLPQSVTSHHPTMRLRTYAVDPAAGEGLATTIYYI